MLYTLFLSHFRLSYVSVGDYRVVCGSSSDEYEEYKWIVYDGDQQKNDVMEKLMKEKAGSRVIKNNRDGQKYQQSKLTRWYFCFI